MLKKITVFSFLASLIIISVLLVASCSRKTAQQLKVPEVVVTKVKTEDLSRVVSVVGQIVAMEQVNINARVSGFLTKRAFEAGQFVTKGQLLFQIQKEQYEAALLSSKGKVKEEQAQLDYAKIEYNRLKLLYSQNAVSQEKFQLAEAAVLTQQGKLEVATANFQLDELNLSYTDILAPFDGRIGMYQFSVGNMVDIGSKPLAIVTQVDPIWVSFSYSEALFQNILEEHDGVLPNKSENSFKNIENKIIVKIMLSNGTEYEQDGKIDFINNEIDPMTGTIQIRAVFPNPQEKLIAGGYVQVKLSPDKKSPCMVIPQSALQEDQTGIYVFTVNDKHIVEQKYVKLGPAIQENVVVSGEINESDLVISQGVLRVRPGIEVNYTIQKEPDNAQHAKAIDNTHSSDTQKASAK